MDLLAQVNQSIWVAILGDVRSSRSLADRAAQQTTLRRLVETANREFASELAVPFSISGGDEIQAIVRSPLVGWRIVSDLDLAARAFTFRYGLGLGPVATDFADRSWEMDGPCLQLARQAIVRAKAEKRWLTLEGVTPSRTVQFDGLVRMMQLVREGWTPRQREAIVQLGLWPTQKETAARMGLDPSTLSKMLKSARYKAYLEAERSLLSLLEHWWEDLRD